jgi:hypothetical protein
VRRGQPDVAGQRELGRSRARGAVERGDDDLGERLERIEETVARAHQLEDLLFGIARPHRRVQDAHREELGPAAGDDDGLSFLVDGQRGDPSACRTSSVRRFWSATRSMVMVATRPSRRSTTSVLDTPPS